MPVDSLVSYQLTFQKITVEIPKEVSGNFPIKLQVLGVGRAWSRGSTFEVKRVLLIALLNWLHGLTIFPNDRNDSLKGHSRLMHKHIIYHFIADLKITDQRCDKYYF